jgi:hypothetical protein
MSSLCRENRRELAEASHDVAEEDLAMNQPWDHEQDAHRTATNILLGEANPPEANMSAIDLSPPHRRLQQTCKKKETYLGMAAVTSPKRAMPTTGNRSDTRNQPPPLIVAFSWTPVSSHLPLLLPALAGRP